MELATRPLDQVPTVREGALVPVHLYGGVITIVLLLVETIEDALVILASGLVCAGDGAKAHLLPRLDEAFILQGPPPRTTSASGTPARPPHARAGLGVDQLLLDFLLTFVLVGLFFVVVDRGFVGMAVYDVVQDLLLAGNLHIKLQSLSH
jgi:hypothetical protein